MKNVYVVSLFSGIISIPMFFVLLFPIAISQLGSGGTSETFNFTIFAFLIALIAGVGCIFVARTAKGYVPFNFGPGFISLQMLVGFLLFVTLTILSKIALEVLPNEMLLNPNRSPSTTAQLIDWLTVLITLLFQQVIFWRIVLVKSSNKN